MAAEITNAEKLEKAYTDARVAEYFGDRRTSIGTSKLLKSLGFMGTVVGAGLLLAASVYAPPATLLSANLLANMAAAGKVALWLGAPVMAFGAIKEVVNRKTKP